MRDISELVDVASALKNKAEGVIVEGFLSRLGFVVKGSERGSSPSSFPVNHLIAHTKAGGANCEGGKTPRNQTRVLKKANLG